LRVEARTDCTAMCTTSFHPPFGERSKILHSVRASNLANNCSERLWLHARTFLVALENYSGWLGELSRLARGVELKQLRTCRTCLTYASSIYASSFSLSAKTQVQRCLYREVDEIWQYRMGGNLTIFNKDHGTVLAAKHTASLQLLCTVSGNQARSDARTECKILELSLRGGWKLVVYIAVVII